MGTVVKMVALFCAFVVFVVYSLEFLIKHETIISEEEIIVSRINLTPLSHTEFAVNLSNGNEEIRIYGGLFETSWSIKYNGTCKCITEVYKQYIGKNIWYVSHNFGTVEEVYFSSGKTVVRTLSLQEAQPYFDEGIQIRNAVRKRFAEYLPSEK